MRKLSIGTTCNSLIEYTFLVSLRGKKQRFSPAVYSKVKFERGIHGLSGITSICESLPNIKKFISNSNERIHNIGIEMFTPSFFDNCPR